MWLQWQGSWSSFVPGRLHMKTGNLNNENVDHIWHLHLKNSQLTLTQATQNIPHMFAGLHTRHIHKCLQEVWTLDCRQVEALMAGADNICHDGIQLDPHQKVWTLFESGWFWWCNGTGKICREKSTQDIQLADHDISDAHQNPCACADTRRRFPYPQVQPRWHLFLCCTSGNYHGESLTRWNKIHCAGWTVCIRN